MVAKPSTPEDVRRDEPEQDPEDDDGELLGSWDPGQRDRVKMAIVSVMAVGGLVAAGATRPQVAYVAGGVVLTNGLVVDGVHQRIPRYQAVATVLTLAWLGGVAVLWPVWETTAAGLGLLFVAGIASRWVAKQPVLCPVAQSSGSMRSRMSRGSCSICRSTTAFSAPALRQFSRMSSAGTAEGSNSRSSKPTTVERFSTPPLSFTSIVTVRVLSAPQSHTTSWPASRWHA
jgi:hypothetical protein